MQIISVTNALVMLAQKARSHAASFFSLRLFNAPVMCHKEGNITCSNFGCSGATALGLSGLSESQVGIDTPTLPLPPEEAR
mmetsp:Transcript_10854/g.18896  ORF Transcript_10854/g.18896 Transcript_10854/m.18896 type:complete len:81 (-) Transcript_10854:15-257(-)